MFQPFFTTKADGLGMGLSICRSNVEAHGGRFWVPPRTPHGADVGFTVPLWAEHQLNGDLTTAIGGGASTERSHPRTEPDPAVITRNRSAAA
jgi:hypothetical protein